MELKSLYTAEAHESGAELQVKNPVTGELTDFYITIAGVDSKTYREALRNYQRAIVSKKEADELELLVAVTKGWRGLESEGKPVEFSADKARELYENAPPIAQQVDRFIVDRRNFTKG